ncbi:MAG: alcohol dehydrogenase catalytic domain-containing protein [Lachnospiraceae bacterium]|nr:alcohol dehydrogenase catalytic domain-containing protein [Lachnospiraceae bacterium]
MLQEVMMNPGQIVFNEVERPVPKDNEVLVKMMRIGICGSDIHVYHGTHPYTGYPVTQGHEVSGIIEEVGKGVNGHRVYPDGTPAPDLFPGQLVTIEPQDFCGECYPCRHGKYNLCERLKVMGFQTTGAGSEYFAVDASKIDVLPEGMTLDEGAMIEPLAVTVHAAKRFPELPGSKVLILGAGPIGILLLQSVKALGASFVMMTDVSDYRLSLARSLGADVTVNTRDNDFTAAFLSAFGPDKADVIYDCAGSNITMEQAIQNARKGSTIILVAVFGSRADVDLAKLNDSELDLNTSMMYRHEDYQDAIRLVSEGKIRLKPLMSRHFAFRDFPEAYKYIDANREKTMKVIVDVQD